MPAVSFGNLLAVVAVALLVPLLLGLAPRLRLPSVVLEILAGVALGPGGLGLVRPDLPVQVLAVVGLAFLLFLAGLEIDVRALRGRPLALAAGGYLLTLTVGGLVGLGLHAVGWVGAPLLLAVTLSATSLGLVVPVLKDAGLAASPTGGIVVAAASLADFAAVLLLSLLFSADSGSGGGTGERLVMLAAFAVLAVAAVGALRRGERSARLSDVLVRLQDSSAQIRVRAAVLALVAFVVLAQRFGLETILGAFVAGAVVGLIDRDAASHPHFRLKLEGLGYGLVIPVFFVSSGLTLDLRGLLASPAAWWRVPVFLAALLVVRGVAALPLLRELGPRGASAAGLLLATSLPFIVTATQIGMATGRMTATTATALVCAGLASVLVFPASALRLLRQRTPVGEAAVTRV